MFMPLTKETNKNTRSVTPFNNFPYKHEYLLKTFCPYTTTPYNELKPSIRYEQDILGFKSRLKSKYRGEKVRHYSGGILKQANSLHSQLQLKRYILAAHGFVIDLNTSDICICSRPDMTTNFLKGFLYHEEPKILHEQVIEVIPKLSTYSMKKKNYFCAWYKS